MEGIKEAFSRVREDIDFLYSELSSMKQDLDETKNLMVELGDIVKNFDSKLNENIQNNSYNNTSQPIQPPQNSYDKQTNQQTDTSTDNSTLRQINSTTQTDNSTNKTDFKPSDTQNSGISKGNGGVPTDRQTDKQTNQQTENSSHNQDIALVEPPTDPINSAVDVLDSLDELKKEIRLKFKRLTDQEMSVFSLLFQLTEEYGHSDYRTLSLKLNLSESSIRDYIGRLMKKGIPVEKKKINNKNIQLIVSPNLKKIANLDTILQLRDI